MTYQELNQYILHYLIEDKTKSAIMLTAPWGTGKSHYIQNELKPFLEKEENGNHKCIIVSLYGLKDLFDISKSLFIESRAKLLNNDSETAVAGKFAAKTIIKGVTSFFGIDLSKTDDEMQELFESVDLSEKLVVFEDLERSGIDIIEVLGYVNNLVEQDGVKVLLVANESEIIQYKPIEAGNKEEQESSELVDKITEHRYRTPTEGTLMYFKVKEKTISDTIQFEEDYPSAIQNIIQMFHNETLNNFSSEEQIAKIMNIMKESRTFNLRSFIFACQKATDVFRSLEQKYLSDEHFVQAIFFGILAFVLKQKAGNTEKWGRERYFSRELGCDGAPLFKFCYDYVVQQIRDFSEVEESYCAFKDLVLYDEDKSNNDSDILVLQNYYVHAESDVINALKRIEKRLQNPEDISFYQYGTIAIYGIVLHEILGYDITEIKKCLVQNLRGKENRFQLEQIFRTLMDPNCPESMRKEYDLLWNEMAESLKLGDSVIPGFDYKPEQSDFFYRYIADNRLWFYSQNSFASDLDIRRLAEMFKCGTAEQKDTIRKAFMCIYSRKNILDFGPNDKNAIEQLLDIIKKDHSDNNGDKIQQKQYDWFIENLTWIARRLS